MNNRFGNTIKSISNIVLGLFLIGFILYRRFIATRLPKDLHLFQENNLNISVAIAIVIGLIVSITIIYQNVLILYNQNKKTNMLSVVFNKIGVFLERILQDIYNLIMSYIPEAYDKISYFAQKFYALFKNTSETLFFSILLFIRAVILFCFLIDVFVYFRLEYMYKALYLLIISLCINLIFYLLKDFASNLSSAEEVLIINDAGIDKSTDLPLMTYKLKKEYAHLNLEYHVEQFILCSKISGYLDNYNFYSHFLTPRINVVIYSIYLIGWCFVLFCNI